MMKTFLAFCLGFTLGIYCKKEVFDFLKLMFNAIKNLITGKL